MPNYVSNALGDLLRQLAMFLPKAAAFVAILAVGFVAAALCGRALNTVLERVGFDRAVERGGVRTMLASSRYDASGLVSKLAYYTVVLFALQLAFGIWGPNPVSDLIRGVVAWLPKAFVAIVIVVVTAAIARAVRDVIGNVLSGMSYGRTLGTIASAFILGLGVIAALNQVGVATTVTTPVLIAVLATVGGVIVVGAGGGLVKPMQYRWESWLGRAEREVSAVTSQTRAYTAGREAAATQMTPVADAAYASSAPLSEELGTTTSM